MFKRTITAWMVSLATSVLAASTAMAGYPELPLDLGSCVNFAVVAKAGITNASALTQVTGDISNSPGTAAQMNSILCSNMNGYKVWGVDAAYTPTGGCYQGLAGKATADLATFDMETAYVNAAGRITPDATELGFGVSDKDIAGLTFAPGLYKWSNSVLIGVAPAVPGANEVTLAGNASDVWIFQIAGDLTTQAKGDLGTGIKIILSGGAKAENVYWQVGGVTGATLETYTTFNGNILSLKQIVIKTGAVLNGRALAQTQVTLDANPVTYPPALIVYAPVLDGHLAGSTTVSGQPFVLTMTVTNTGNANAINVAARAWNSIGQQLNGPTASSTSYQTLYVGQNVTFSWTATQTGSGNYIFSATAMEESTSLAISPTSTSSIYLTYAPVLKARLDGMTPATIGQVITFNLTVTNTGGATAMNVAARAWNAAGVRLNPTTVSSTAWISLYPGQSVRFTWTTTSAVNGTLVFSATAAETSWMMAVSPLATATVIVQTAPVLDAKLTSWSATVAGGPFLITLTVTNNGQASTSVSVTTTAFLIGNRLYTATAYTGPTPAMPFTLASGGSATFTWTVNGINLGAGLPISNTVYGTDVNTGLAVSPVVLSNGFVPAPPPATVTSGPPAPGADGSYIYPSPSRGDTARIVYTMAESGTVKVRIYNAGGNLVVVLDEPKPAGLQTSTVTVSRLSPGVYFYILEREYAASSGQKIGPRKFVVTR